jgi:hypothetical protein
MGCNVTPHVSFLTPEILNMEEKMMIKKLIILFL